MFLKIPMCLYISTMRSKYFLLVLSKNNVKEITLSQTRDISQVYYNLIKHVHDVTHVLYGAIELTNHSACNSSNILMRLDEI